MRILEIIPQLSSGGAERFTVDLCNDIAIKHDVTLVMLHPFEGLDFYKNELSTHVELISLNKRPGVDLKVSFKIYRLIKTGKFDVVHTHLRGIVYTALSAIAFHRRVRFFHTLHNDAFKEGGRGISLFIRKLLFTKKWVIPITISETSENSFRKRYGFSATLITNGRNIPLDLAVPTKVNDEIKKYKKDNNTRILINLARFQPVKRQPLLAHVASRLSKEGYNFTLLFIGNTKTEDMVSEVEVLNCPDIYILGEKRNPLEYLKIADAYCLCSSYEGLPISLIEALGTGTVPVFTPVGGVVDLIEDGVNGFLSKDISEEAYYVALQRFLNMTNEAMTTMKQKAIKTYSPYSMTQCAQKYIMLFNKNDLIK
jgi:glycosyltransferase involved in cell wall biosynthesis